MNWFKGLVNDMLKISIPTFGEAKGVIKYYPQGDNRGGSHEIDGVFDQDYEAIDSDTEQRVSGNQLVLGVNLNQFEVEPCGGDLVDIGQDGFRVIDVREDGQGGALLVLHRTDNDKTTNKRAYSRFS